MGTRAAPDPAKHLLAALQRSLPFLPHTEAHASSPELTGSGADLQVFHVALSPRTPSGAGSTGVTQADTWRVNGGRTNGFVSTALLSGHCHGCSRSRGVCNLHGLPLGMPLPWSWDSFCFNHFRFLEHRNMPASSTHNTTTFREQGLSSCCYTIQQRQYES